MRQKSTIMNMETHNQFEGSGEDIKLQKKLVNERIEKDKREGQSDFRLKKKIPVKN